MARKNEDLIIIDTGGGVLGVKERPIGHKGDTIEWLVHNTTGIDLKNIDFDFSPNSTLFTVVPIKSLKKKQILPVSVTVKNNIDVPATVYKFTVIVDGVPTVDPELEIQDARRTKKKKRPAAKKKPAPKKKKKTVRRK
jgi:hypothetical protein